MAGHSLATIYRSLVLVGVPLTLAHEETEVLVDDLIALDQELGDEDPASVFFWLQAQIGANHGTPIDKTMCWLAYMDTLMVSVGRREALSRVKQSYPPFPRSEASAD